MNPVERNYYFQRYRSATDKIDIYAFFVEWAHTFLLRHRGSFGMIISRTWLTLGSFRAMRAILLDSGVIRDLVLAPDTAFEATVDTAVLISTKLPLETPRTFTVGAFGTDGSLTTSQHLAYDAIPSDPERRINLRWTSESSGLRRRIEGVSDRLEQYYDVYYGCKTGDETRFISGKPVGNAKRVIHGEDIEAYVARWNRLWLDYDPNAMVAHRPTARPGTAERFEVPSKLVFKRISGTRLQVVLDGASLYSTISTIVAVPESTPRLSGAYHLALLNSRLMTWYASEVFGKTSLQTDLRVEEVRALLRKTVAPGTPVTIQLTAFIAGATVKRSLAVFTDRKSLTCLFPAGRRHFPSIR